MIISILFFSALLGGLSVFLFRNDQTRFLKLILSFSGAYLFSITVLHLIPGVYHSNNPNIGLFVLAGFLFQLVLEQFSEGVEHGHMHGKAQSPARFPFSILLSLCLHAFLEGMPITGSHQYALLFGIALHHIPAAFALGSLLLNYRVSSRSVILYLIIFSAMSPLGSLFSQLIQNGNAGDISQYFDRMMAVVIGIFLHISTTILFESSSKDHQYNRRKLIAVFLGVAVSFLNFLL